jgi:hypothetical protein
MPMYSNHNWQRINCGKSVSVNIIDIQEEFAYVLDQFLPSKNSNQMRYARGSENFF